MVFPVSSTLYKDRSALGSALSAYCTASHAPSVQLLVLYVRMV